jgi:DNA-binding transcriptional ArsR family regulator
MSRGEVPTNPLAYALTNDVRVEILKHLAGQRPGNKMCARDLSEDLNKKFGVISYHVQVLFECGAIRLVDPQPPQGVLRHFYVFDVDEPWALTVLGLDEHGATGNGSDEGDGTAAQ